MDSASKIPLLPWIGGSGNSTTPYECYLGCLKIAMVKKDTPLTIGVSGHNVSESKICFCGHAFVKAGITSTIFINKISINEKNSVLQ